MDKRKIVKIVAKKNGMSQKDVTMVFDEIFNTMLEGLKEEGHVGLAGFGSFNVKKCAVRHRYVLSTQKVVLYPETQKVIFRVAKQFKFKGDGVVGTYHLMKFCMNEKRPGITPGRFLLYKLQPNFILISVGRSYQQHRLP